jgi:hypothetical protein
MKAKLAPRNGPAKSTWPGWAKAVVSVAILWQLTSLFAAELGAPPSSPLEQRLAEFFLPWHELTDQGLAHRFYSDIGPTPILQAELRFADGQPPKTIRIPNRSTHPRLVYQRQLALANAVFEEFAPALVDPDIRVHSRWAESIAHYLAAHEPGCKGVIIRIQMHRNPSPGQMIESAQAPGAKPLDPDSEEFYDVPRLVGDYPWPIP